MDNLEEQIRKIMAKSFLVKMDQLTDNAQLVEDVGVDSLGVFEMVINLEDDFQIEFQDKELLKFQTVGEAIKVLADIIRTSKS